MKKILVLGAGGFIGNHLVRRLKSKGHQITGVDLKYPEFTETVADEFIIGDLRDSYLCQQVIHEDLDEIYQFAADMGGAGFIFTGENDANVMHNSASINLNVASLASACGVGKLFYSSSACVYPEFNQLDPQNPNCAEHSAYPAQPDSDYGWEKLFSERLYSSYRRNYNLNVRIARFHNIYGPEGTWEGGREKAPAAICRKVALAKENEAIEIWGDGLQTRSFLFYEDCLDGIQQLMNSDFMEPVNIGSEEMISIQDFTKMIIEISGKKLTIKNIKGPLGVRGRNSDNQLVKEKVGWEPKVGLKEGIEQTYHWILRQVKKKYPTRGQLHSVNEAHSL